MDQSLKGDIAAVLAGAIVAAIAGTACYIIANDLIATAIAAIAAFAAAVLIVYAAMAFAVGVHAFLRKKDVPDAGSCSTLNDIEPVDGEMNRSDDEKP